MLAGESDAAVARRWDLTPTAVTIHRAKHLVTSPANMSPARREAHEQALSQFALAKKANRVGELQSLYGRLQRVMEARAAQYQHLPGGDSGLVSLKLRSIGSGADAQVVEDAVFDAALVQQAREVLKSIAGELGEWDITGAGARSQDGSNTASITIVQAVAAPVESPFVATADARPGANRTLPAQSQTVTIGPLRQLDRELRQSSIRSDAGQDAALPVADDGGGEGEDAAPGG